MFKSKTKLLSTVAAVPLVIGAAVAFGAIETISGQANLAYASSDACNPCAAKKACNPCNPCAAKKACNPCNPCAAKKACNPCNPCAAKKACNPCNPCAAKKACNPCNPCAAKKACNPCNPCAAKKACNPCNPCAAGNPCNPCAASASGGSKKCFIPRLRTASACNPCAAKKACNPCNPCAAKKACNPCAAKKACNPCNPCAAKKACNPCAAKKASNPCNPCGASNPCNPCGAAAAAPELTKKELVAAYECLYPEMVAGYAKAGIPAAKGYKRWAARFSSVSYPSDTHGGRMVNNYSNSLGKKAYAKYEDLKKAPLGSVFIKDSFSVGKNGSLSAGPIFLMEKKQAGFDKENGDWRYYMIMPNGTLFGTTKGKNAAGMKFCSDCHSAVAENDFLYFLPEEFRVSSK